MKRPIFNWFYIYFFKLFSTISTAEIRYPNLYLEITEVIENIRFLLGFVFRCPVFRSFSPIFNGIFRESDELILVRSSGLMVTGLVNAYDGLYEIRIHDGSGYLFNITKLGLKQSLAKTQMIQSGNFFVFERKIQFLLNNGLKFEVLLSILRITFLLQG